MQELGSAGGAKSYLELTNDWAGLARAAGYEVHKFADKCGVCVRHLERILFRETGKTPRRWLIELRQLDASTLLAAGASPKAVAIDLGYKHLTHFSRDFKLVHRMSPRAFLARENETHRGPTATESAREIRRIRKTTEV
jgi:AraC-like DNA-binding protein